jgi:hypothetical protein
MGYDCNVIAHQTNSPVNCVQATCGALDNTLGVYHFFSCENYAILASNANYGAER